MKLGRLNWEAANQLFIISLETGQSMTLSTILSSPPDHLHLSTSTLLLFKEAAVMQAASSSSNKAFLKFPVY